MLPTTIHHPIMPVEWGGVSNKTVPSRFRGQGLAVAGEGDELGSATGLTTPPFLPSLDLRPCPLIDGVMNRHNARHVLGLGLVPLALHRVEEHLLARVDPVPGLPIVAGVSLRVGRWHGRSFRRVGRARFREGTRDGRDFPVLREAAELGLLIGRRWRRRQSRRRGRSWLPREAIKGEAQVGRRRLRFLRLGRLKPFLARLVVDGTFQLWIIVAFGTHGEDKDGVVSTNQARSVGEARRDPCLAVLGSPASAHLGYRAWTPPCCSAPPGICIECMEV
ncbi:hypothetical protein KC326_g155 [Hortaea werneckii]|nr:hypothetical protein KC326_g155 [Hortaea werneckii]